MKRSIKLMVAITVLMVAGNAVAGDWRFANISSYTVYILPVKPSQGGQVGQISGAKIPSKVISPRAVGTTESEFEIFSTPSSGKIKISGSSIQYGKTDNRGNITNPQTLTVPAASASNPPVFVIDVGFRTGLVVKAMSLSEVKSTYPTLK